MKIKRSNLSKAHGSMPGVQHMFDKCPHRPGSLRWQEACVLSVIAATPEASTGPCTIAGT